MKENVPVQVFFSSSDGFYANWPPENAVECLAWFTEKVNLIPMEYRNAGVVEIQGDSDYGESPYSTINITYKRIETDDEETAREEKQGKIAASFEKEEMKLFKRLSEKFGDLK